MPLAEKPGCTHDTQTLVQAIFQDELLDSIWFAAWQCDHCGGITQKPVTSDDLEGANELPWLDEDGYERATTERQVMEIEILSLQFFNKAVAPPNRNGNGHR